MPRKTNAFKETFEKSTQKVIEYGISKTFYKDKKLSKDELNQVHQELEEYRKSLFKIIYETNPDKVYHLNPIKDYIIIVDNEYCTWNEEKLNQLPTQMLSGFANSCEYYNNITL